MHDHDHWTPLTCDYCDGVGSYERLESAPGTWHGHTYHTVACTECEPEGVVDHCAHCGSRTALGTIGNDPLRICEECATYDDDQDEGMN